MLLCRVSRFIYYYADCRGALDEAVMYDTSSHAVPTKMAQLRVENLAQTTFRLYPLLDTTLGVGS